MTAPSNASPVEKYLVHRNQPTPTSAASRSHAIGARVFSRYSKVGIQWPQKHPAGAEAEQDSPSVGAHVMQAVAGWLGLGAGNTDAFAAGDSKQLAQHHQIDWRVHHRAHAAVRGASRKEFVKGRGARRQELAAFVARVLRRTKSEQQVKKAEMNPSFQK